jgi:hypothetical protein
MGRSLLLVVLSASAFAQPLTLVPHQGTVTLQLEEARVECPVTLELTFEQQRVRSLVLTLDTTRLGGSEAKRLRQLVFLDAPMQFTSTQVRLKLLPEEEVTTKGFFGRPTSIRAYELTASGTFRLAGKERKLVLKGMLSRSEASALAPASTHVRLEIPALRRADFGLSTELPWPRVELIGIPLLLLQTP